MTAENWANYWLNEGMAEFMPGQYWGVKQGPHAEQDYYLAEYRQFLGLDARRRMPLATYNSNNVYPKGALVLEMLKAQLGPERFWAAMRRYLTRHAYGSATSDDLRQAVLDATGQSLPWFWSQWIYSAGYPAFAVTAAYDSAAHALTLDVRQTQTDTATADSTGLRYATPLVFRAPVTIRVGTSAGDVVRQVTIDRREQRVLIDRLPAAPTMVAFDDSNAVLKSLAFEQPTPWLATLLERHPHLWQRAWAIAQLGSRPTDTLAGAALARAATGADYSLTRADAARALGGFPSAVALPALEAAARDTSAEVREAAVATLGAVGGDRALASRETPGAPTRAIRCARTPCSPSSGWAPRGAREAVLQGLETPSYREAIQNVAVTAVVQRPDSGLVLRSLPAARRAAVPRDRAGGAHVARRHDCARRRAAGAGRRATVGAGVDAGGAGGSARGEGRSGAAAGDGTGAATAGGAHRGRAGDQPAGPAAELTLRWRAKQGELARDDLRFGRRQSAAKAAQDRPDVPWQHAVRYPRGVQRVEIPRHPDARLGLVVESLAPRRLHRTLGHMLGVALARRVQHRQQVTPGTDARRKVAGGAGARRARGPEPFQVGRGLPHQCHGLVPPAERREHECELARRLGFAQSTPGCRCHLDGETQARLGCGELAHSAQYRAQHSVCVGQLERRVQLVEDARRRLGGHPGLAQATEADQGLGVIHDGLAAEVEVACVVHHLEAEAEVVIGVGPSPEVVADDTEVVVGDGAALFVPRAEESRERALEAVECFGVIALGARDRGEILLDAAEQIRVGGELGRLAEEGARFAEPLVEEVDAPGGIECLGDETVVAHFPRHRLAPRAQRPGRVVLLPPAAHDRETP